MPIISYPPNLASLQLLSGIESRMAENAAVAVAVAMIPSPNQSYPPIYHHQPNSSPPPHTTSNTQNDDNMEIPAMDLQDLDPSRLGEACREWGILRLANHGIPRDLSTRLMNEARRILSLPFEDKKAKLVGRVLYFWGSPVVARPVQGLHLFDALQVALGRGWEDGGEKDSGSSCSSEFRCLIDEYGWHMARIARTVFDALAVDLKLDSEQSTSYLCESDGTFRAYRYLSFPNTSKHVGFHAHTDSSTLSILNQDGVGGLQVLRDERWFDVAPIPDTLIVNLGDMMQAISSDKYKSAEHRVVVNTSRERMSLCYFAFPSDEGVISNSTYKAFTYKDFRDKVQEDIEAFGYKVGLERFKISDSK